MSDAIDTYRAIQMIEATPEWRAAVLAAADEMAIAKMNAGFSEDSDFTSNRKMYTERFDAARARLVELLGGSAS